MIWNNKELVVFDIESDNLYFEVSKIWCLCYCKVSEPDIIYSLTDYEEIKEFFLNPNYIRIAHNGLLYDFLVAEKLLDIKISTDAIDTLFLSWVLNFERPKHSLESFGEEVGVSKIQVEKHQWEGLTKDEEQILLETGDVSLKEKQQKHLELMILRCTEDVKINTLIWLQQWEHLLEIYETPKAAFRFINYLTFKGVCIQNQIRSGIKLDVELCKNTLKELEELQQEKLKVLAEVMPPVAIKNVKIKPKVMYRKDGTISTVGEKWFNFLKDQNLPEDTEGPIEYITEYKQGNPSSHLQLKEWLYSLGWIPDHIQVKRDKKTNKTSEIPQIKHPTKAGEVSDSVRELFSIEPRLEVIANLGIISHRIAVFKGFLDNNINGRVYPSIAGLTNTLRFKHSAPCVNLVATYKPYGEQIRNALIADEGHTLVGADISSAEDFSKRHFIQPIDPQYVKEQMTEGFDPHLKIAVIAGYITEKEMEEYKVLDANKDKTPEEVERYKYLKKIRLDAKILNFSSIYNIAAPALARQTKTTVQEAQKSLEAYWKLNWSVKVFANSLKTKEVRNQTWVQSPLNGFWLLLRKESDKFSTVNQNASAFLLDTWISILRKQDKLAIFQYQDELLLQEKNEEVENTVALVKKAMEEVNKLLKMRVPIGCSVEIGDKYGSCH